MYKRKELLGGEQPFCVVLLVGFDELDDSVCVIHHPEAHASRNERLASLGDRNQQSSVRLAGYYKSR